MRILAITNLYPRPGRETFAAFNRQQFAALAEGHELAVVAPVPWTEEWADRRIGRAVPGADTSPSGIAIRHPRFYFTPKILRPWYGEFFLASIRAGVRRLIEEFRPDAVLGCWAHPDGWAAARLAREAGLPCVIKVVGSDVLVAGRGGRRGARVAEALRSADAVVAVSRHLAAEVVAKGVDPARVRVVPSGLDASLFSPGDRGEARARVGLDGDDRPVILFVGNLLLSKGAGVLLEAMKAPALGRSGARCILVGRGKDEARLRAMVAKAGLAARVRFAGPRPHRDLPDWYRAADVVALPSFSEGIPNVLLEASACGRPFVATRVGGIPEIADRAASRLVPPGDPGALAVAIAEVLGWGPGPASTWSSWAESAELLAGVLRSARDAHDRAGDGGDGGAGGPGR